MPDVLPHSESGVGRRILLLWAALVLVGVLLGILSNHFELVVLPGVLLIGCLAFLDFRKVFFLMLGLIPFAMEVDLPGGFSTDFPTEFLVIGLMGVYFLYLLQEYRRLNAQFLLHPLSLLVLLHLGWILATTITSQIPWISLKFFLAKCWYVVVFFYLAGRMLRSERDIQLFFWVTILPLCLTAVYAIIRHYGEGFSFMAVNRVVVPFYRNHVNYACLLVLMVPLTFRAFWWYRRWSFRWWVVLGALLILLVGIQLSFTRAAYVSVFIAAGGYFIIRYRLVKPALLAAFLGAMGGLIYMVHDNTYLQYAPNFERTITHKRFDRLVEATFEGEDISTMERVYRWVAGWNMVLDKPLMGFGPGNYPRFYKEYTVTRFRTYVSNNPDNSGIHNYYLMTLIEQGLLGLLIFLGMCTYVLLKGEGVYRELQDTERKRSLMAFLLSGLIIFSLLLINDLMETIKVGPYLFLSMAVLVNMDLFTQGKLPPE